MDIVITKDGSITFFNSQFQETYHSTTGAIEEAQKKFIDPARSQFHDGMVVLDICFGFGYNTAACLDRFFALFPNGKITIIGFEIDQQLKEKAALLDPPFKSYDLIKTAMQQGSVKTKQVDLSIVWGDVLQTIYSIEQKADVVFLDPFSPKKHPELWSEDFFRKIAARMKQNGILTTYSCARIVRDNLRRAGFLVSDGPCIGRRGPSTVGKRI
ncbi:hypothetical protein HZB02_04140 [Candidatus Woesearchaeota archaeon]|nr:hypothetical protein [Candidatus Woesearchaeota archaeon]